MEVVDYKNMILVNDFKVKDFDFMTDGMGNFRVEGVHVKGRANMALTRSDATRLMKQLAGRDRLHGVKKRGTK